MYHISYDEERILLTIVYKGYWSMEMFKAYEVEACAFHDRISQRHKNYRVLTDGSEFEVQSTEIGQAFEQLSSKFMSNQGPIAMVINGAVSKIQVKRVTSQLNRGFFTNRQEALVWLFEDGRLQA